MPTLGMASQRYVIEKRVRQEFRGETVPSVRSVLADFLRTVDRDRKPSYLTRRHIERWLYGKPRAVSTIRKNLSIVRSWCKWMVDQGWLVRDPTIGMRNPKEPRRQPRNLRRDEVSAVYSVTERERDELIVTLMVQLGLRRAEVADAQVGDIDFGAWTIRVTGKGGHERVLPVPDEARTAILRYLGGLPRTAGPLIRSLTDPTKGIRPPTVGRAASRLMRAAGVSATGHALRHTAAHDMLETGAHLRDVQAALGHKSIKTTERYLGTVVIGLDKAMGGRTYRLPSTQRPASLPFPP